MIKLINLTLRNNNFKFYLLLNNKKINIYNKNYKNKYKKMAFLLLIVISSKILLIIYKKTINN